MATGGKFPRKKVWSPYETVSQPDLNAEFDNIIQNLKPDKVDGYSLTVGQMQSTQNPGAVGSETLAATLAQELQELRYMVQQLSGGAQWYSTPAQSLSQLNNILSGIAYTPSNRIISGRIDANNQATFLVPSVSLAQCTLKAASTNFVVVIQGTSYTFNLDLTLSVNTAPASNNTCLVNDGQLTGQQSSKLQGERGTNLQINTLGSALTPLSGYQAFKIGTEYFIGEIVVNSGTLACSFSNASPTVVTATAHGQNTNDQVIFTGSNLPLGITSGTIYYVTTIDANTFNISATLGGSAINAISPLTVTFTNASPTVVTSTVAHTFVTNDTVVFTGTVPTGLTAATTYFVTVVSGTTFKVSATQGGAFINTSSTGSGTITAVSPSRSGTGVTGTPSKNTYIKNCFRGVGFNSSDTYVPRVTVTNGATVTLMKLAWIFATFNSGVQALDVTYNQPTVSYKQPTSPGIGDYWLDLSVQQWKKSSGASFVLQTAIPLGFVISDSSVCQVARAFNPIKGFSSLNDIEIEYVDSSDVRSNRVGQRISSYGTTWTFDWDFVKWNTTTEIDSGVSLAPSTTYWTYITDLSNRVFSDVAPYDRRADMLGHYHPAKPWRCVGEFQTDGSSNIVSTSVSFERYFGLNIPDGLISSRAIGSKAVQTSNIGDKVVLSGNIGDKAIASTNIADQGVLRNNLVSVGQQISGSSGSFSTASVTFTPITNLSVTLVCTGRPVVVFLTSDSSGSVGGGNGSIGVSGGAVGYISLIRDGASPLFFTNFGGGAAGYNNLPFILTLDRPTAGSHTFSASAAVNPGASNISVNNLVLIAYEL